MSDVRLRPIMELSLLRDSNLRSTVLFLAMPVGLMLAAQFLDTEVPESIAYALALILVPPMFLRAASNPEWVMAAFIVYVPLARLYPVLMAPGINAINLLMLGLLIGWIARVRREKRPMFTGMPLTGMMWIWGVLSCLSFVTALFTRGPEEFLDLRLGLVRIWLDQFFVFFAFINLIRDAAMARRIAVYLCIGGAVITLFGFAEWIQKADVSTMEKSRLLGPLGQPNDLAAFVAYSSGPFIALFVDQVARVRVWLMLPYLVVIFRVLLGTFSRGGYIAYGVEGLVALALKGKILLAIVAAAVLITVDSYPELLPESLVARMNETKANDNGGADSLDKSSQTRLILWDAALKMIAESPIMGKGFATFPLLKGEYTEVEVEESDNHNMYLYVASQMGIPALVALVAVIARLYFLSVRVYRRTTDRWTRAVGLGTASMCAGVAAVNMFGSRMLDISVMGYVWMYAAVISHLWADLRNPPAAAPTLDQSVQT